MVNLWGVGGLAGLGSVGFVYQNRLERPFAGVLGVGGCSIPWGCGGCPFGAVSMDFYQPDPSAWKFRRAFLWDSRSSGDSSFRRSAQKVMVPIGPSTAPHSHRGWSSALWGMGLVHLQHRQSLCQWRDGVTTGGWIPPSQLPTALPKVPGSMCGESTP